MIANTAQVKAEIAPDSIVFREEFEEVKESLDQTKVTEQDLRELIGEETVRAKNAETKNAEDIKTAHENSKAEIDKKIADLIGGAPETLDTLKEVADAIKENESVTDALNQSIGQKANAEDFNELNKNALLKTGDTKDNTTLFVSRDRLNPTEWTDVDTLESEEKHSSIFEKISTMVKNVRYLYKMLGSTDISAVGNGTVTGAINSLNTETPRACIIHCKNSDDNHILFIGDIPPQYYGAKGCAASVVGYWGYLSVGSIQINGTKIQIETNMQGTNIFTVPFACIFLF